MKKIQKITTENRYKVLIKLIIFYNYIAYYLSELIIRNALIELFTSDKYAIKISQLY